MNTHKKTSVNTLQPRASTSEPVISDIRTGTRLKEGDFVTQNQPSTFIESGKAPRKDRLYFLDWLRVFAILLVFLVHSSKIFDYHTTVVIDRPILYQAQSACVYQA